MHARFATIAAALTLTVIISGGTSSAQAATLGLYHITDNSGLAGDVEDQLSVSVTGNSDQAVFTFYNTVGIASSLTDIYFEDTASLFHSIFDIVESAGVAFFEGAAPPDLSGGEPYAFTASFSADADPNVVGSGVDRAEESVSIVFQLMQGIGLDGVLAALQPDGGLRIGVRVQTIDGGHGDSFITPSPVPLPPSLILFLTGLMGIGLLSRSQVKRKGLAVG